MPKSTITDLPNDIRQAVPNYKENHRILEIIRQAQAGEFHDYKNKMYDTPKLILRLLLKETKEPALLPIIQDLINGEYDENPDADDKAKIKRLLRKL